MTWQEDPHSSWEERVYAEPRIVCSDHYTVHLGLEGMSLWGDVSEGEAARS